MKRCVHCRKRKPRGSFYNNRAMSDGLTIYCKPCCSEAVERTNLKHWHENPMKYLMKKKRYQAKKFGIKFTLDDSWLEAQPSFCPYLGLDFVMTEPGSGNYVDPLAPSFDQIEPGQGYTPDNTRLISWWANRAKGDMSDRQFMDFCLIVEERIGGRFD